MALDPFVEQYFASLPDGAARLAQALAINEQVRALEAPQAAPAVTLNLPAPSRAETATTVAPLTMQAAAAPSGVGAATASPLAQQAAADQSVQDRIKQIYLEQLGRPADPEGLAAYTNFVKSGQKTLPQIAEELDRTTDGYNYDRQQISSAYRQNFGRNPDEAGIQYWMGQEDKNLYSQEQLVNQLQGAATGVDVRALADNPEGFAKAVVDALAADPFAGGFAVDNPYIFDEATAALRPNVSKTAAGQYVQFVNPVTQQPTYSGYTPDGQFKVFAGKDVLQPDRVRQAVNLATISGALTQADATRILDAISTPEKFREITGNEDPNANTLYALLSEPKANIVLDRLGVQIGEDANASLAMAESAARQQIVDRAREQTGQNINPATLLQADVAREMGVMFPFTKENLTIDPATGLPIRTMMTAEDLANNLFTYLNIPTDKTLENIITSGLGNNVSGGVTPGGGTTPPAVVGTTGDFRGLAFPEARPTTIGETPAMLGFQPYTLTQPGSGQQKTTEPKPVIPVPKDTTVDPTTGALLGAAIGSLLPSPSSGAGVLTGVNTIVNALAGNKTPINWNQSSSVQQTPGTYYGSSSADVKKDGGLATPLMKEGGMVPRYADGGTSQVALGIDQILQAPSTRGALIGALMSNLLTAQARSQAANAYRGIDMSKVGVIPPRSTMVGPVRFAPYRQYASRPEIPSEVSSPINVGALTASQTPMFTRPTALDATLVNPLARPAPTPMTDRGSLLGGVNPNAALPAGFDANRMREAIRSMPPGVMDDDFVPRTPLNNMPMGQRLQNMFSTFGQLGATGQPMADGGAAYYTYGQQVDPMDYLGNGMAYGGLAHGGDLHHADNAPVVSGRKDYRAGSAVTGPGDGQSDDIPALLADGEYVFDADTVAQLGNGSTKAGSKILDRFREEIRSHKRSAPVNKIPPPAKSPLAYLAAAQKKGASRG